MLLNTDIGFSRIMTNRMSQEIALMLREEFQKIGGHITNETQSKRDMVAHGLWSRKEGNW